MLRPCLSIFFGTLRDGGGSSNNSNNFIILPFQRQEGNYLVHAMKLNGKGYWFPKITVELTIFNHTKFNCFPVK